MRLHHVELLLAGIRDSSNQPVSSAKIYSYDAGTTTPKALYSAYDGSASHANPLICDGMGMAQAWASGAYKFVIKDADDATLYTYDNLLYPNDDETLGYAGTSSGAADIFNVTTATAITSYTNGMRLHFRAHQANTTAAAVLNVNSIGAKTIKTERGNSIKANAIVSGGLYEVIYYSNNFYLVDPSVLHIVEPLDFNSQRSINIVDANLRTGLPSYGQVQDQPCCWFGTTGGTSTAYTATLTPAITAYIAGQTFRGIIHAVNGATPTLNLNSLGAKAIRKITGQTLGGYDIRANQCVELVYDGTDFILVGLQDSTIVNRRANSAEAWIANVSTEQVLFTYALPANRMGPDGIIRVHICGDFYNGTGGSLAYTMKFKFGSQTVFNSDSVTIGIPNGSAGSGFIFDATIQNISATGLQRTDGKLHYVSDALSTTHLTDSSQAYYSSGPLLSNEINSTQDTTLARDLILSGQMASASANGRMRVTNGFVELLG